MMKKIYAIIFLIVFSFSFFALPVQAAFPSLVPAECAGDALVLESQGCSNCNANDEDRTGCCCNLSSIERTVVNVAQIILGLAGSVALMAFVAGGISFILSQGDSAKVKKSFEIIKNAVIGLAIILFSGALVQVALKALTSG